jgi:hypothetical protein
MKNTVTTSVKNSLLSTVIFFTILVSSCSSQEIGSNQTQKCNIDSIIGDKNNIIGRWRLLNNSNIFGPTPTTFIDYSCENIIFEFRESDTLKIENNLNKFPIYSSGLYNYSYTLGDSTKFAIVAINNFKWICIPSESKLVLDASMLDGGKLNLIRIN